MRENEVAVELKRKMYASHLGEERATKQGLFLLPWCWSVAT